MRWPAPLRRPGNCLVRLIRLPDAIFIRAARLPGPYALKRRRHGNFQGLTGLCAAIFHWSEPVPLSFKIGVTAQAVFKSLHYGKTLACRNKTLAHGIFRGTPQIIHNAPWIVFHIA